MTKNPHSTEASPRATFHNKTHRDLSVERRCGSLLFSFNMMNGNSISKPEGVHQRTMSAEEDEDREQLPLLDPNAVIRPLEMDLGE